MYRLSLRLVLSAILATALLVSYAFAQDETTAPTPTNVSYTTRTANADWPESRP